MFEKVIFTLLAFSLFMIIFSKIIRRDDTNYIIILILDAIGITISFIEIKLAINQTFFWKVIRYLLSIIIPLFIIIVEFRGYNFSEILSVFLAKFCTLLGKNKEAKNFLIKLVTKYPDSYLGHKMLAQCYEKEGGMRKAIDEYVRAIDIKKNDDKSYFKITKLLKDLGKKDEAIEMLDTLLKTKPECYDASILLGELLCEQEKFKEASRVYIDALKYRPADFDLYYNLGIVYTRLSDFQMAKEMYEKAAEINHRMYGANYNLGLIAFMQQEYDVAEEYFQKSIYGELEADSYYQLAKVCIYKGEKDKAIMFLNKSIELEPKLLQKAINEETFINIKEYITVSVKMDDDSEKVRDENSQELIKSKVIIEQEKIARKYLEDSFNLIQQMSENISKEELNDKIDYIFNREKLKKEKIMQEIEELKQEKKKNERQKELGNN